MPTTITGQNLVNAALQDMGRIAPGETPNANMSNAAFTLLNEIISSWSRDGRITFVDVVGQATLTAGLDVYAIGAGQTWSTTTYPQKVKGGRSSFSGFQCGVTVVPMEDFQKEVANEIGMTAALVKLLGVDSAAPYRNVRVFPMPNVATVVELSWSEALTLIATLASSVTFPVEGWEYALRTELIVALCPSYGLEATQTMAGNMQRARSAISGTGIAGPSAQMMQQMQMAEQAQNAPPQR